jgi:hypothetical protein
MMQKRGTSCVAERKYLFDVDEVSANGSGSRGGRRGSRVVVTPFDQEMATAA